MQAVRGGVPGARDHHRIRERDDGTRRTTRYDIDLTKCIFCGFCEEAARSIRSSRRSILEYHGEKRGDLIYTKDMLLAVGDRYESEIAADRGGGRDVSLSRADCTASPMHAHHDSITSSTSSPRSWCSRRCA